MDYVNCNSAVSGSFSGSASDADDLYGTCVWRHGHFGDCRLCWQNVIAENLTIFIVLLCTLCWQFTYIVRHSAAQFKSQTSQSVSRAVSGSLWMVSNIVVAWISARRLVWDDSRRAYDRFIGPVIMWNQPETWECYVVLRKPNRG